MKHIALVAASSFNAQAFLRFHGECPYNEIVAVDGGYVHLKNIDVTPTLALGDFDSLGFVPADVPTQTYPEQKDESDLALALSWCASYGDECLVTVYGAFAQRLDHTLAALQEMAKYAGENHASVCGVSENEHFVVLPSAFSLRVPAHCQPSNIADMPKEQRTASILSLCDCSQGVTISGLKYELDHACITNQSSLGLSNELMGTQACVSLEHGCVLVVLPLWANPVISLDEHPVH